MLVNLPKNAGNFAVIQYADKFVQNAGNFTKNVDTFLNKKKKI